MGISKENFWGDLIRTERYRQGISQRALAESCSVPRGTLRRMEEGKAVNDIYVVERLLNYLGYDIDAIARNEEDTRTNIVATLAVNDTERSTYAAETLLRLSSFRYPPLILLRPAHL